MLEPELVRGSPTRTGGDRSLAGGLQHRAPAQLAKVSDAGRVRRQCGHATGVSPHAGRLYRPSVGRFGCAPARLCYKSRRVPCAKTVPESDVFMPLGLALSEKQIPQITENTEKSK